MGKVSRRRMRLTAVTSATIGLLASPLVGAGSSSSIAVDSNAAAAPTLDNYASSPSLDTVTTTPEAAPLSLNEDDDGDTSSSDSSSTPSSNDDTSDEENISEDDEQDLTPPQPLTTVFSCGTHWRTATSCTTLCIDGDSSHCPPGEYCYAGIPCTNDSDVDQEITLETQRMLEQQEINRMMEERELSFVNKFVCGMSYEDAEGSCNTIVPTSSSSGLNTDDDYENGKGGGNTSSSAIIQYPSSTSSSSTPSSLSFTTEAIYCSSTSSSQCPTGMECYANVYCPRTIHDPEPPLVVEVSRQLLPYLVAEGGGGYGAVGAHYGAALSLKTVLGIGGTEPILMLDYSTDTTTATAAVATNDTNNGQQGDSAMIEEKWDALFKVSSLRMSFSSSQAASRRFGLN